MKPKLIVYWSRRDFRLTDNPALYKSIEASKSANIPLLPIFILEDYMTEGNPDFQFGYPGRFFLSKALPVFSQNFDTFMIFRGTVGGVFDCLNEHFDLEIYTNDDVYTDFYKQIIKLKKTGFHINIFNDQLTVSKSTISGTGNIYTVFSPFKKNVWQQFLDYREVGLSEPRSAVSLGNANLNILNRLTNFIKFKKDDIDACSSELLQLFSPSRKIKFDREVIDLSDYCDKPNFEDWYWSESEALSIFDCFVSSGLLSQYKQNRDSLELDVVAQNYGKITINGKTSKMSLGLAWGLVSARTLKNKILEFYKQDFTNFYSTSCDQGALCYLSELIWREFYKYIYYHKPEVIDTEFQEKYRGKIQWVSHDIAMHRFVAWIKGETGYRAVDAAMNQLAKTGWMHNRARMMVASILTKNLGVDWRWGQEYFRAVLLDLDEASNNGGWQWGSSTGSDPKPIRIFNPYLQAENYDKSGVYQKKWLPVDYDLDPIVEHKDARSQAMKRYGLNEKSAARDF